MPASPEQTLIHARAAMAVPTLYWLGYGGYYGADARPANPGEPINVQAASKALKGKDRENAERYRVQLEQAGVTPDQLPRTACDCSGLVTWALELPRGPNKKHAINTDWIYADATGPKKLFVTLKPNEIRPGALLVYRSQPGARYGHVGVISDVTAEGRITKIIHCSAKNLLIDRGAGQPRQAIAETDTTLFDPAFGPVAVRLR